MWKDRTKPDLRKYLNSYACGTLCALCTFVSWAAYKNIGLIKSVFIFLYSGDTLIRFRLGWNDQAIHADYHWHVMVNARYIEEKCFMCSEFLPQECRARYFSTAGCTHVFVFQRPRLIGPISSITQLSTHREAHRKDYQLTEDFLLMMMNLYIYIYILYQHCTLEPPGIPGDSLCFPAPL